MAGVFDISVTTLFSAAHALAGYPGGCSQVHGHTWRVTLEVRCRKLDPLGMGMDFNALEGALQEAAAGLDHRMLNELPEFADKNPTAENLAVYFFRTLGGKIRGDNAEILRVRVQEGPGAEVCYHEE
jgi:6-pyruvoyltetrahydropterin/6-carboxytetrahydropterin synthase